MAPQALLDLVKRFEQNRDSYTAPTYNEAQLRTEFLNPLLETLGWDVSNRQGYAEAYKEVISEDAVKIGDAMKAPDYSCRIGGTRKFFIEAKKPSVKIKDDPAPAFQLRRYAWSAKLPLSILTDFEEFSVYDCRRKPDKNDAAGIGRVLYLRYTDYPDKWDEIASKFSKEAILKGSFDRYAETSRAKKGTAEVDAAFLEEIEKWRDLLARNIAVRNPGLNARQMNFAVQRTIDRLIFLRICEDRGIEEYGTLQAHLNGDRIFKRLQAVFTKADEKYNSGLFHFRPESGREESPDTLTPSLEIDDKVLKEIIGGLYYPDCPYAFSVLPADILGQVYEQFLGKVIHVTAHRAKVEDKPEVKKAGGVFYTPTYIVDYIVKNTVGKLLEGKTPKQAAALRILDPACGSGSFLIGAYQYLLDWHRDWYVANDPKKHCAGKSPALYQARAGEYRLTSPERKRILTNNIYGVDIDTQAVEVTKLSLLLKVLEGENEQTISQQLRLFNERALPDLGNNIKCGNSLIGSDYRDGEQIGLGIGEDEEEQQRINAFDWDGEHGFKEIMKAGGFDAVIGNPPYGVSFKKSELDYLSCRYSVCSLRGESYLLFTEKAHNLLKISGVFGFIIPDTYLNLDFSRPLREFILHNSKISEIVVLPSSVFKAASVDTTILLTTKEKKANVFYESQVRVQSFFKKTFISRIENPAQSFTITSALWSKQGFFNTSSNETDLSILDNVDSAFRPIEAYADMFSGIKAYEMGKGIPPQTKNIRDSKPFTSAICESKDWSPFYDGKHIGRYQNYWHKNNWIKYGPWLAAPREAENFDGNKILIRKIVGRTLIASHVEGTNYCNTLLFILKPKINNLSACHFFLGILNSRFIGWYFRKKFQISADDTFPQIMIRDIIQFPIPEPTDVKSHRMQSNVSSMLSLHQRLPQARTDQEKAVLTRQIEATDRQIDKLVYELYGLTEEEIAVVEGNGKAS